MRKRNVKVLLLTLVASLMIPGTLVADPSHLAGTPTGGARNADSSKTNTQGTCTLARPQNEMVAPAPLAIGDAGKEIPSDPAVLQR